MMTIPFNHFLKFFHCLTVQTSKVNFVLSWPLKQFFLTVIGIFDYTR